MMTQAPEIYCSCVVAVPNAGSSAVVCAPTSSGKTFISSYIIEQVLKPPCTPVTAAASNRSKANRVGTGNSGSSSIVPGSVSDGIVVIVLPTKALVNQLAAQVSVGERSMLAAKWKHVGPYSGVMCVHTALLGHGPQRT